MMPQAVKQLSPLLAETVGSFASGQGVAQYAVPAVAKTSGLFGGKRVHVPLSEPLPGVDIPKYIAPAAANLEVRRSNNAKGGSLPRGAPRNPGSGLGSRLRQQHPCGRVDGCMPSHASRQQPNACGAQRGRPPNPPPPPRPAPSRA
jgi:hypothetical protein